MGDRRAVGGAPRFADDLSVAEDHDPVDAVEFFVEFFDRLSDYIGVDADRFGDGARQRAVSVQVLSARRGGAEKKRERRGIEENAFHR